MTRPSSLANEDFARYFKLIQQGVGVRRHFDLLIWLQGDMQEILAHEIMLSAWGDFRLGLIAHDIVSALPGVRTERASVASVSPLMSALFKRWIELGKRPFALTVGAAGFLPENMDAGGDLGQALQGMRSALIHGICDERGRHDCLYVLFSGHAVHGQRECNALELLLPHIDTALRQVPQLNGVEPEGAEEAVAIEVVDHGLSERELEIMSWVKMGKTNQEVGMILDISSFTVKNHLKRIFKKLAVYNRVQAVARFETMSTNGSH